MLHDFGGKILRYRLTLLKSMSIPRSAILNRITKLLYRAQCREDFVCFLARNLGEILTDLRYVLAFVYNFGQAQQTQADPRSLHKMLGDFMFIRM